MQLRPGARLAAIGPSDLTLSWEPALAAPPPRPAPQEPECQKTWQKVLSSQTLWATLARPLYLWASVSLSVKREVLMLPTFWIAMQIQRLDSSCRVCSSPCGPCTAATASCGGILCLQSISCTAGHTVSAQSLLSPNLLSIYTGTGTLLKKGLPSHC